MSLPIPAWMKPHLRPIRRRWIESRLALRAATVDAFLVSYPKSGRTWLRYLLSIYMSEAYGLGLEPDLRSTFRVLPNFDLDPVRGLPAFAATHEPGTLPLIAVSHRDFDPRFFAGKPVILMVRDPRDVCVSAYFHQTRHKHRFQGSIEAFIGDEAYGIPAIIAYHNGWGLGLAGTSPLVISYEEMSADAFATVRRIIDYLAMPFDEGILRRAIDKAAFEQMRKDERSTGIPGHDYNAADAESARVRKGKVGGFGDYLDTADVDRIDALFRSSLTGEGAQLLARTGYPA